MARTNSPLRYPGGKSCLFRPTIDLLKLSGLERGHYAEPYAGGAGLALSLLFGGHVTDIHINDIDIAVWSFWHSVLHRTSELVELIETTSVTIDEWHRQRSIYLNGEGKSTLDLAFATFFLNRTNRSGIIKSGGVIGGLEQKGSHKIDCRYNTEDLIRRILRIKKYEDCIHLSNMDAANFMRMCDIELPQRSLFFIDPPYFKKGADLYANFYKRQDHRAVSEIVIALNRPWIVTYDYAEEIENLYHEENQYLFNISYSASVKRKGTEIMIASRKITLPANFVRKFETEN